MDIRERAVDGVTVLDLSGKIVLGEGDVHIRDRIKDLLADGQRRILLNLADVTYIDSAGLGIVLSHWAHTQRIGVKFAAVGISERVQVLLDMTGVSKLLPQYPTADDAERAFSSVTNSPSVASV